MVLNIAEKVNVLGVETQSKADSPRGPDGNSIRALMAVEATQTLTAEQGTSKWLLFSVLFLEITT